MSVAPFRQLGSGVLADIPAERARRECVDAIRELQKRLGAALTTLETLSANTGATLADGDYGDVTVSGGGAVITIDNAVVDYANLAFGNFTSSDDGLVPASGGSALDVLHGDGSWSPDITSSPGWFGNGLDGSKTVAGTETIARDMYYTDLTVPNGTTLNPSGFCIYVSGTLTIASGGKIARPGNNASGATAGAALSTGSLDAGTAGSNGAAAAASNAGTNGNQPSPLPLTGATSGRGGAGGTGPSGAGGQGGALTNNAATNGGGFAMPSIMLQSFPQATTTNWPGGTGGGGGGGGGGGAAGAGGGGGGGGGCIAICARFVVLNGTIEVPGGAGGNASGTNAGGGGGGGGGKISLLYQSKTGSGSCVVTGGAVGTSNGTGGAAAVGSTGYVAEQAI